MNGSLTGRVPVEVWIAGAMLGLMEALSLMLGPPISFPAASQVDFLGLHYVYPLVGTGLLGGLTMAFGNRATGRRFLIALPCYAIVLLAHFNLKLWAPHINPLNFDALFWSIDSALHPLVSACMVFRASLTPLIPYGSNVYLTAFIIMFYASFLFHAVRTPEHFPKLVIAVLLLQSLGAVVYVLFPAVGPFIYEPGVNPVISHGQDYMLSFYRQSAAEGSDWLRLNASSNFTAGLGAMPSLHAGGSFLFFLFAARYGRVLLPLYSGLLVYIITTAIATRWHYLIDIPVGMALAYACYRLSIVLTEPAKSSQEPDLDVGIQPLPA